MKGLLIKDLFLLKNQKRFLITLLITCAVMLFTNGDPSFVINYSVLIFSMLALSTVSYDEMEHGFSFLFILPINRAVYVREKYVFCLLIGGAAWLISILVAVMGGLLGQGWELSQALFMAFISLAITQLLFSVTLPLQLKFGAEKGRVVMMAAIGFLFAGIFVVVKKLKHLDYDIGRAAANLEGIGPVKLVGLVILVCLAASAVSYYISLRIMEKKEF